MDGRPRRQLGKYRPYSGPCISCAGVPSMRRFLGGSALIGLLFVASSKAVAAPVSPLDRVPADAALFAHLSAGNLWDHPAVAGLRKFYAKELEKVLKDVEKETGLRPEQIQSVTFHFPKFPQGQGDERLFVLQVVT